MTYKVELVHSEEGYSVGCTELPGCYSQGQTEDEALANIKSAISDYLTVVNEIRSSQESDKKIVFVDVPEQNTSGSFSAHTQSKAFTVVPIFSSPEQFTKVEDLLDRIEGLDRR